MQAIVSTLGNGFGFIGTLVSTVWGAILGVLDAVFAAVVYLIGHGFMLGVDVMFWLVTAALAIVPDAPGTELAGATDSFSYLGMANTYIPLTEAAVLAAAWVGVFTVRAGWKLYKGLPLT